MNDWPTRADLPQEILDAAAEAGVKDAKEWSDVVNDTQRPCVHEWRLIYEERGVRRNFADDAYMIIDLYRWYCVFCRTIEETSA